jgi:hypothetical protein
MPADPNPPDPAPIGDQPTWTTRNGRFGYWEPGVGETAWVQKTSIVGCDDATEARAIAALVEAVHRSQQLDTALDIIARIDDDWVWDDVDGCWRRGTWGLGDRADPPDPDAVRAVLALAERRHRD